MLLALAGNNTRTKINGEFFEAETVSLSTEKIFSVTYIFQEKMYDLFKDKIGNKFNIEVENTNISFKAELIRHRMISKLDHVVLFNLIFKKL